MYVSSKGYKIPQTGDRGWWDNLVFNWLRINTHNHDGVNSEKITTANITKTINDINAANWIDLTNGNYRQTITLPVGVAFPDVAMKFYINGGSEDGSEIYPSIEKITSNTYYIYINDNTLSLKVVYA